jgi:hypothetical protein
MLVLLMFIFTKNDSQLNISRGSVRSKKSQSLLFLPPSHTSLTF